MKLKHAANFIAGGTPSVDDPSMWSPEPGTGTPWISIGDMSHGGRVVSSGRWISDAGIRDRRLTVADPGTVLFAMYASVGAIATLGVPATWNQAILGIRPVSARADSRFVAYWLQHIVPEAKALVRASTQDNLNADQVANFPFSALPLQDQRRIADFLDDQVARIDNIIAARREQLTLLSRESQASLDTIFKGTDDKATRLGRFVRRIEQGWSPQCDSAPAGDDEWGVTKVSAIRPGRFIEQENKRLPDELEPQREYEIRSGDLLLTRANTPALVGAFAVAPSDVRPKLILSDKIMRIDLDPSLIPEYVALFGQTTLVRDTLSGAGTGTSQSMVNIRGADIRDLRIPLCDTNRQLEMVGRRGREVSRLRERERLIAHQMELLTELKRSLITAAVTGEFDVSSADGSQVPVA